MVYVSNGHVLDSRTRWRLSFLSDIFWGVVEFFSLFFQTIFKPNMSKDRHNRASTGYTDGRRPPDYPSGRRMGRINHGAGPNPPPMGGGG